MPVRPSDPRQARILTWDSLRWIVRHRAWTPYYLRRYWRFLRLRRRHPDVITEGMVFLDRDVEIYARPGYGRIILGKWVHLGAGTSLRAHEGTLRVGDKVVMGRYNTVNAHLDIEIGDAALLSDLIYICDFDHVTSELDTPIKDQGIVKSPVRIGPDCWIGIKATVLRGARIGRGCVLAAHTVTRADMPAYSIVAGIPGRVVKDRAKMYAEEAARRAYLEGVAREASDAAAGRLPEPRRQSKRSDRARSSSR